MKYKSQNHYIYSCNYHIVFCPKYRRPILKNGLDIRLKEILNELAINKDSEIIEMEVMPDHVHLLVNVPPSISPLEFVKHLKRQSANKIRKEFPFVKSRLPNLWTRSCFISSTGGAPLEEIKKYIENQK